MLPGDKPKGSTLPEGFSNLPMPVVNNAQMAMAKNPQTNRS